MPSIVDRNISWNRKFVFYGARLVHDLAANVTTTGTPAVFYSHDSPTTADQMVEIGTTDLFALQATVTGALDVGSSFIIPTQVMPYDLDPTKNVGVGVVWTHDNTAGATTLTWAVTFSSVNFGANIYNSAGGSTTGNNGGVLAEPTTALSTPIAAQTNFTVANLGEICVSPRGIIAANTFNSGTGLWSFRTRLAAGTIGSTKIFFLGLLVDYSVRKTRGSGVYTTNDRGVLANYLDTSFNPVVNTP